MKFLFFTLVLISCSMLYAQETKNKAAPFVRVYDQDGKKISKGRIASVTDTSLITGPREKPVTIEVSRIGLIKTKRSAGHNIFLGAAIGAGTGAILGLATGDDGWFSQGETTGMAGVLFGIMGTGVGAISATFKKSDTYYINGEPTKWKAFRETMDEQSQLL
ncbi:MAG: hypothetical protein WBM77_03750 [Maribacter sp.]|uniref:hypothetical protein n=1 Tax=Eudoraea sp. TaxID=1979955 RepID=UPI003C730D87